MIIYYLLAVYALLMLLNVIRAKSQIMELRAQHRRGAISLRSVISVTLGLIFLSYIFPEAITAIQSVNTSAWTFTGHAGASALWGLIVLVAIAGFMQMMVGRS